MREKAQKGSFRVSSVITVATRVGHRERKRFTASFSAKLAALTWVEVTVGWRDGGSSLLRSPRNMEFKKIPYDFNAPRKKSFLVHGSVINTPGYDFSELDAPCASGY